MAFFIIWYEFLVGTLLEVGRGLRKPEEIPEILEQKDRQLSRENSTGPWSLFMESVLLRHFGTKGVS